MDVRCDRCQTEYELDDDIVTDAGASVQCTTCGHTFFVRRHGRAAAGDAGAQGRRPAEVGESGLASASGGLFEGMAPASPEWTLDTEDGKLHRFRELNTLQKWIVERRVTREDRVSHAGGPFRLLGELPELLPFFAVVEEADRARLKGGSVAGGDRAGRIAVVAAARSQSAGTEASMEPTISFSVPVAEAFRRASDDGPTVPDRRLFDGGGANGAVADSSTDTTKVSPMPGGSGTGVSFGVAALAPKDVSGASHTPPPVPADAGRIHGRGASGARRPPPTPRPGTLGPIQPANSPRRGASASVRQAAVTETVFPPDATAEAVDLDFLRPSRAGRSVLTVVMLVFAVAGVGGGYLWYRSAGHPGAQATAPASVAAGGGEATLRAASALPPAAATPPLPAPGAATEPAHDDAATAAARGTSAPLVMGMGPTGVSRRGADRSAPLTSPGTGAADDLEHAAAGPADVRPVTYEKLVVEGNRLRAHGNLAKASKLYEQALSMRPDGVMALTGTGYVQLEHQRHFKAIDFFRRALAIDPTHGPALFGIAEAYRARGDTPEALAAYRQYLAMAPSGSDVTEARRQIKALSSDDESP